MSSLLETLDPKNGGPRILSRDVPELRVPACAPCLFVPDPDRRFEVVFAPGGDGAVPQVEVKPRTVSASNLLADPVVLQVEEAWSPFNEFVLQAIDLNFDGKLDLAFGPITGVPNLTLNYWVDDGSRWVSIGRFTNLEVNTAKRELMTHATGGQAGLLFEDKIYRWEGDQLSLIRSVEQTQDTDERGYHKTTRTFESGQLVKETTQRVKAP